MRERHNTTVEGLLRAARIGEEEGLRFVYAGNLPGTVGRHEDTRCPSCSRILVRRRGYLILGYEITREGTCPDCSRRIPGIWWSDDAPGPTGE